MNNKIHIIGMTFGVATCATVITVAFLMKHFKQKLRRRQRTGWKPENARTHFFKSSEDVEPHNLTDQPSAYSSDAPGQPESKPGFFQRHHRLFDLTVAAVWIVVVGGVMAAMIDYSYAPGKVGATPDQWPQQSKILRDPLQPTLIMFAHPHCPCTRSTLGELELLMARCHGKFNAQVWFIQPPGVPSDWMNTDLVRTASAIPGVTIHADVDCREAQLFQAETSGQTMLYDPSGNLLFKGGITLARGHSGDNPGRTGLVNLLEDTTQTKIQTPVFGCDLFESKCRPESETWKR